MATQNNEDSFSYTIMTNDVNNEKWGGDWKRTSFRTHLPGIIDLRRADEKYWRQKDFTDTEDDKWEVLVDKVLLMNYQENSPTMVIKHNGVSLKTIPFPQDHYVNNNQIFVNAFDIFMSNFPHTKYFSHVEKEIYGLVYNYYGDNLLWNMQRMFTNCHQHDNFTDVIINSFDDNHHHYTKFSLLMMDTKVNVLESTKLIGLDNFDYHQSGAWVQSGTSIFHVPEQHLSVVGEYSNFLNSGKSMVYMGMPGHRKNAFIMEESFYRALKMDQYVAKINAKGNVIAEWKQTRSDGKVFHFVRCNWEFIFGRTDKHWYCFGGDDNFDLSTVDLENLHDVTDFSNVTPQVDWTNQTIAFNSSNGSLQVEILDKLGIVLFQIHTDVAYPIDMIFQKTPYHDKECSQMVDLCCTNLDQKTVVSSLDYEEQQRDSYTLLPIIPLPKGQKVIRHIPRSKKHRRLLQPNQKQRHLDISMRDPYTSKETQFWKGAHMIRLQFIKNRFKF